MNSDEIEKKVNEIDETIKNYSNAIESDPQNYVLYNNRSIAYLNNGEFNKALNDAEKTISIKSDWPEGYSIKGKILELMSRVKDAFFTYKEGLKYDYENEMKFKDSLERLKKENVDIKDFDIDNSVCTSKNEDSTGGQVSNPFADPDLLNKPKIKEFLKNEPTIENILISLKTNPDNIG